VNESLVVDEDLRSLSSVRLFVDRMQSSGRIAEPNRVEVRHIATICRIVEGIPLAIELAAARSAFLPLDYIADGLQKQRFVILAGGKAVDRPERHETLWKTIDWSYELLDPVDRTLFSMLSVFPKDFTVTGAAAVCLPTLQKLYPHGGLDYNMASERIHWLIRCCMIVQDECTSNAEIQNAKNQYSKPAGKETSEDVDIASELNL